MEDRYDGLLTRKRTKGTDPNLVGTGTAGDYNLLQLKLDSMLTRLCEGIIRDRLGDGDGIIVELEAMIRAWIVTWATAEPVR